MMEDANSKQELVWQKMPFSNTKKPTRGNVNLQIKKWMLNNVSFYFNLRYECEYWPLNVDLQGATTNNEKDTVN